MEKYQYTQQFEIRYRDVDFKDEMKPSVALALMEEVAGASADELGFGYRFLKPNGYAFVVSNTCVEFTRPVSLFETIKVNVWRNHEDSEKTCLPHFKVFGPNL